MPVLEWWIFPLLFLTGLVAGFVDSIAGGGGIISLPVLLNLGLPPQVALGTNKLQATFGSASATWQYGRAGLIPFHRCRLGVVATIAGAALGSVFVTKLSPEFLRRAIPCLLLAIAIYLIAQPSFGQKAAPPRLGPNRFHLLFGLLLGFYDGFFGPGTGTFWAMAYVLGLGLDLRGATAHTKLMNLTSNVVSLLVFGWAGQAHVGAGLSMGLGQLTGARLGSRVVIHRGAPWIRPILIVVALAITVRLLWQNFSRP
jgi:uncharacterized membrane protein YfcA